MLTETRTAAARAVDLRKVFGEGLAAVEALRGVSVEFDAGEYTAIMGASGSGKSTLLHCMAGLDKPTSGTVWIGDQDLTHLKDKELTELRRDRVGFVFQAFNLRPDAVGGREHHLAADIAGRKVDRERFDEVIDTIGLRDRLTHLPCGALRRSAAARRRRPSPGLPAGDRLRGRADGEPRLARVAGAPRRSCSAAVTDRGQTIVMVTHDPVGASYADRIVFLADGRIVDEMRDPTAERVLDRMKSLET